MQSNERKIEEMKECLVISFSLLTGSLGEVISSLELGCHFYADDTQLILSFFPLSMHVFAQISACLADISAWTVDYQLSALSLGYYTEPWGSHGPSFSCRADNASCSWRFLFTLKAFVYFHQHKPLKLPV